MLKLSDDKLNRKPFLDSLFSLFNNFGNQGNRGFTMIINGKYGSGKSTLLGFIEEYNKINNDLRIIKYNSWENNLFENPLIPILYEVSKLEQPNSKLKDGAINILKSIPKLMLNTISRAYGISLPEVPANNNIFTEYDKYKDTLSKFRDILIDSCKDKKVLFLVDELDRCLPKYQIEVLETIYHLLEIPNFIIVIALDKSQLERSIKSIFGDKQNVLSYLAKFIDYQVDLPDGEDTNFFHSLMKFKCGETDYLVKSTISNILGELNYPLRESQKIINEINLICNEFYPRQTNSFIFVDWYPAIIFFLDIIKYENNAVYNKFFIRNNSVKLKNNIAFEKSNYYAFLDSIKGTKLEKMINYLNTPDDTDYSFNQYLLINFINLLVPVNSINIKELARYFKLETLENMQTLLYYAKSNYHDTAQNITSKINKIKF